VSRRTAEPSAVGAPTYPDLAFQGSLLERGDPSVDPRVERGDPSVDPRVERGDPSVDPRVERRRRRTLKT